MEEEGKSGLERGYGKVQKPTKRGYDVGGGKWTLLREKGFWGSLRGSGGKKQKFG